MADSPWVKVMAPRDFFVGLAERERERERERPLFHNVKASEKKLMDLLQKLMGSILGQDPSAIQVS